jgi:hypothetical protein
VLLDAKRKDFYMDISAWVTNTYKLWIICWLTNYY